MKNKLPSFLNDCFIALKFKQPVDFYFSGNRCCYWTKYDFNIVICNGAEDKVIGNLSAYHYHSQIALKDGLDDYEAFDTFDTDNLYKYSEIIWNHRTKDFSDEFIETVGYGYFPGDLFILDSINIFPQYRGYELGNTATWLFYYNFCNPNDILILLAFPLQFGNTDEEQEKCKPNEFKGTQKECTKKLANYYKKLGFERIGKSNFYVFSCENNMKAPEILSYMS